MSFIVAPVAFDKSAAKFSTLLIFKPSAFIPLLSTINEALSFSNFKDAGPSAKN
jgi:hypothetical protein